MRKSLEVIALVLAALSLTMTSAHVLELPAKLAWPITLYAEVNGSLYRWFAIIGGGYTVAALAAVWALCWALRSNRTAGSWAVAAALLLTLAFVSWLALVMPVNRRIADAAAIAPERVPELWRALRARWEYGHAAGFVLDLAGFCALAIATVQPLRARGRRRAVEPGKRAAEFPRAVQP